MRKSILLYNLSVINILRLILFLLIALMIIHRLIIFKKKFNDGFLKIIKKDFMLSILKAL